VLGGLEEIRPLSCVGVLVKRTSSGAVEAILDSAVAEGKSFLLRYLNAPVLVLPEARVIIQLSRVDLGHIFEVSEGHSLRIVPHPDVTLLHDARERGVVVGVSDVTFTAILLAECVRLDFSLLVNEDVRVVPL